MEAQLRAAKLTGGQSTDRASRFQDLPQCAIQTAFIVQQGGSLSSTISLGFTLMSIITKGAYKVPPTASLPDTFIVLTCLPDAVLDRVLPRIGKRAH